jgi:NAD(P)-dependent dehydrogenase (short-subunit alcohol dehydrogenase family)
MGWSGKAVAVTGAASGIGRATALQLAAAGATVHALDRDAESLAAVAAAGALTVHLVDVSDPAGVSAAFDAIVASGPLYGLVNVAGGSGRRLGDGPVHLCSDEGWEATLAMNLRTTFLCCRAAIPTLLAAGGGAIVNVASVLALVGGDEPFATHAYAAAKGGVIALTRAIAAHYASAGIRANALAPGLVATPMSARAQQDPAIGDYLRAKAPLTGTFLTPESVADAAVFLLSDAAASITGAVLPVDGGWTTH